MLRVAVALVCLCGAGPVLSLTNTEYRGVHNLKLSSGSVPHQASGKREGLLRAF